MKNFSNLILKTNTHNELQNSSFRVQIHREGYLNCCMIFSGEGMLRPNYGRGGIL